MQASLDTHNMWHDLARRPDRQQWLEFHPKAKVNRPLNFAFVSLIGNNPQPQPVGVCNCGCSFALPRCQIEASGVLGEDGTLTVEAGGAEVAVVYFRAGYAPNDYFGRAEWDARLKLERSTAIKSPSIGYHLAGTKKVQQVLAQEGQVRKAHCTLSVTGSSEGWILFPSLATSQFLEVVLFKQRCNQCFGFCYQPPHKRFWRVDALAKSDRARLDPPSSVERRGFTRVPG